MTCTAEFFIEPFREGEPGPHVVAALAALEARGIAVDVGPFGNRASGPVELVVAAMADAQLAAIDAGATRFTVNLSR